MSRAGVADPVVECRAFGMHDRAVEDRTDRGANRLWVEDVDTVTGRDDRIDVEGVGRANDRAEITRAGRSIEYEHERLDVEFRQSPSRASRDRDGLGRCIPVGKLSHEPGSQVYDFLCAVALPARPIGNLAIGIHNERFDRATIGDQTIDGGNALDEDQAALRALPAVVLQRLENLERCIATLDDERTGALLTYGHSLDRISVRWDGNEK